MITLESAQDRIEEYITKLEASTGEALCVLTEETIECASGWVFFFNSSEFIKTGNPKYALAGNAPILVDKSTGATVPLGTAYPVADYIDHYTKTGDVLR